MNRMAQKMIGVMLVFFSQYATAMDMTIQGKTLKASIRHSHECSAL